VITPEEYFLTEVSARIPDTHEKSTLFSGWYSNRTRGFRKRHGLLAKAEAADRVPGTDDRAPLEVRRSWARLIRKVYEVDPPIGDLTAWLLFMPGRLCDGRSEHPDKQPKDTPQDVVKAKAEHSLPDHPLASEANGNLPRVTAPVIAKDTPRA
jgi:hypothetical protein